MITEPYTTQRGRGITLVYPDMYQFVCGDIDAPNSALEDITNLYLWGGALGKEESRVAQNVNTIKRAFDVAALCCPELVLRGPFPEGALTPADLLITDLAHITAFFQSGGSPSAPVATDNESHEGAHDDSAGAAVEPDASGVDRT